MIDLPRILLGEIAGVGDFEAAQITSITLELFGVKCLVLSLDKLIESKRAAGRTKDKLILPELEALREAIQDPEE